MRDNDNGFCAVGIIIESLGGGSTLDYSAFERTEKPTPCPLCGVTEDGSVGLGMGIFTREECLVAHLNDIHGLTFAEIARKLGPDAA